MGVVRVVRARRGVGTHWQPSQVWVAATGVGTHWQPLKKCEPGVGSGEAKRARMGQVWGGAVEVVGVARVVTAWGSGVVRARGSVGLLSKHLGDASQEWIMPKR